MGAGLRLEQPRAGSFWILEPETAGGCLLHRTPSPSPHVCAPGPSRGLLGERVSGPLVSLAAILCSCSAVNASFPKGGVGREESPSGPCMLALIVPHLNWK